MLKCAFRQDFFFFVNTILDVNIIQLHTSEDIVSLNLIWDFIYMNAS